MAVLVLTASSEGGLYSPDKVEAPIRIYSDRRVQDDIYASRCKRKWRGRLSRKDYRLAKKAALENRRKGLV